MPETAGGGLGLLASAATAAAALLLVLAGTVCIGESEVMMNN